MLRPGRLNEFFARHKLSCFHPNNFGRMGLVGGPLIRSCSLLYSEPNELRASKR